VLDFGILMVSFRALAGHASRAEEVVLFPLLTTGVAITMMAFFAFVQALFGL
jgi:hypothetical protein